MKKKSNILWGLFFILAAVLVIANTLGYLAEISLLSLIFLIVITPIIVTSLFKLNWPGFLFSLALIAIVFAEPLGLEAITPWPVLLAALFASIGLSILFRKKPSCLKVGVIDVDFDEKIDIPDEDIVTCQVKLGSATKYVNSKNFKKGYFECSLGAMKIYFDNTKLSKDGAVIDLNVSMSGVELYLPKEWNVVNNCNSSLGGIEEKNRRKATDDNGPIVTLTGSVSLGGVEIIYI